MRVPWPFLWSHLAGALAFTPRLWSHLAGALAFTPRLWSHLAGALIRYCHLPHHSYIDIERIYTLTLGHIEHGIAGALQEGGSTCMEMETLENALTGVA